MVHFFVEKENKIPLYLQLTGQIEYFISTGSLGEQDRLPPVKTLAKTLGINFLTVRKAYKELESNGLLDVKHGEGTFISLTNSGGRKKTASRSNGNSGAADIHAQFADSALRLFEQYLRRGLDAVEARRIVDDLFFRIERGLGSPLVVFAECNQFQIKQISKILADELQLDVRPMLIADLEAEIPGWLDEGREINIVTTGFHVHQVREAVGDKPVRIDVLITNLSPETRRRIEAVGENGRYGFICRDRESAAIYKQLLKEELEYKKINLTACTLTETAKVQAILTSSDVILVSPQVYEAVRKLVPAEKPIYNVFDRVDPMSLKVVRDRILGD